MWMQRIQLRTAFVPAVFNNKPLHARCVLERHVLGHGGRVHESEEHESRTRVPRGEVALFCLVAAYSQVPAMA